VGDCIGDAMRNFEGSVRIANGSSSDYVYHFNHPAGSFSLSGNTSYTANVSPATSGSLRYEYLNLNPSLVVPTANENRPASISAFACITY